MNAVSVGISKGKLMRLDVTLDTETGTYDLLDTEFFPQAGAIVRVLAVYASGSTGNVLQLKQGDGVVLDMGATAGSFQTLNQVFPDNSMIYHGTDTLSLNYALIEAVTLQIYVNMKPQD
jgi:hypothetical protein